MNKDNLNEIKSFFAFMFGSNFWGFLSQAVAHCFWQRWISFCSLNMSNWGILGPEGCLVAFRRHLGRHSFGKKYLSLEYHSEILQFFLNFSSPYLPLSPSQNSHAHLWQFDNVLNKKAFSTNIDKFFITN